MTEVHQTPRATKHPPIEPIPMSFSEALGEMMRGHKVRRFEWKDRGIYLIISFENALLMIHETSDKQLHPLTVDDIVNTDWVIC